MSQFGWISSGRQNDDAVILAAPGKLGGVLVISDGTNAVNLVLYDNASTASGTILGEIDIGATPATGSRTQGLWFGDRGVSAYSGIYADITQGTGTLKYYVWYG